MSFVGESVMSMNRLMSVLPRPFCVAMSFVVLFLACGAGAVTYDASTGYVTVEQTGNVGDSIFHYCDSQPVKYNAAQGANAYYWSDHQCPHSGTNYYIAGSSRGWTSGGVTNAAGTKVKAMEFPGDHVVLNATIQLKCMDPQYSFSFKKLTMLNGSVIRVNQDGSSTVTDIRGNIELDSGATVSMRPIFSSSTDLTNVSIRLNANLSGAANTTIKVTAEKSTKVNGLAHAAVEFNGDNSGFLGTVNVSSNRLVLGSATAASNVKAVNLGLHAYLVPLAANGTVCAVKALAMNDATAALRLNETNTRCP